MPALIDRECAEHIHWHPYSTISKYSIDQTSWAEKKLADAIGWRRLPLLKHIPLGERDGAPVATLRSHRAHGEAKSHYVHDLHGNWLRELFPEGPEDGYAYDDGNILVNGGLTQIINYCTGGGSATTMTTTQTVVGVGTTATAATTSDTALGSDNTANAYYQGSDATFPSITGPATINNQCTFASGNANFAWNEWCWATGTTIAAGTQLASGHVFTTLRSMINHKISSLGTKASGASWVFSTTIVFSL
jgi:hypothetical protein